jgi:uncharacterized protein YjcR
MSASKTYSKADRRQALRLHRKGWGYARIADVIGCFPSTIKKWIEAEGVPKHPGPKRSDQDRRRAVDWYRNNSVSVSAAASRFGVHSRTLSRWLREDGVPIHTAKGVDRNAILNDIRAGMKKKDIASKHGCSESWVYKVQSGDI